MTPEAAAASDRPAPARRTRVAPLIASAYRWWMVVALVGVWEIAARSQLLPAALLPAASVVARTWVDLLRHGSLIADITASCARVAAGFGAATVLGCALGVSAGMFPSGLAPLRRVIELLRPVPPIAWIPLAVLWLGIGGAASVALVTLGAFFPIFTGAYEGVASVGPDYVHAASTLGAGGRLMLTDVLMPAALPRILSGMRVGLGTAWTTLIAAELVGAQSGLGYMIQLNRTLLETDRIVAGMITIGSIGLLLNAALWWLERRILPWAHETASGEWRVA